MLSQIFKDTKKMVIAFHVGGTGFDHQYQNKAFPGQLYNIASYVTLVLFITQIWNFVNILTNSK